jgi:hypothetical protein
VGQYKQNTEIKLPYSNMDEVPEWVSVVWENEDAYISKVVLSERKVVAATPRESPEVVKETKKPVVEAAPELAPDPAIEKEKVLTIFNVKTSESGDSTYITWETNLKSDSRIVIDEDFYVSDDNDSTEHAVSFSDLQHSSIINYKIVAESDSLEASKFGKFTTRPGDLDASFFYSKDEECIVVIIEDANNNAQSGISLKITSDWYSPSGMRFINDTVTQSTTSWGEVEYCEKNIDNIKVINNSSGKVYHDGSLPLYW